MGLRAIKKLVVDHAGVIKILNETDYLKLVREEHYLTTPKLLGSLNPTDKSTVEWIRCEKCEAAKKVEAEQPTPTPSDRITGDKFTGAQKSLLTRLVIENAELLANKGVNNFVNNFNELILQKI